MKIVINDLILMCPVCNQIIQIDNVYEIDYSKTAEINCLNSSCGIPLYFEIMINLKDIVLMKNNLPAMIKLASESAEVNAENMPEKQLELVSSDSKPDSQPGNTKK